MSWEYKCIVYNNMFNLIWTNYSKTEVEQFKNVLEHPVFQADPLAAIRVRNIVCNMVVYV